MNLLVLYSLFFLVGLASEFTYARWTQKLIDGSKESVLWACLWGLCNVYFLVELAGRQDFTLGYAWILGVMLGTVLSLKPKERTYEYIYQFTQLPPGTLTEGSDPNSIGLECEKVRLADFTRKNFHTVNDKIEELEEKLDKIMVERGLRKEKHGKRKVRRPRLR